MDKQTLITKICDAGLVAVVRSDSIDQALRIADACMAGGVAALEITYTIPGASKVIEKLAETFTKGEILLGAGTVLDPETARQAILSGAQYVISPYLNTDTIKLCNRYGIACMPGCMTVTEVVHAMEAGADVVKLFPGDLFGPAFIKNIRAPLPQVKIMPTGGVSLSNAKDWIAAGAVALGVGGNLVAGAKTGDYASITKAAKEYVEQIQQARATK